jgi:histone H1/5
VGLIRELTRPLLLLAAVLALKERKGSSRPAIKNYIVANYSVIRGSHFDTQISAAIKRGSTKGIFALPKGKEDQKKKWVMEKKARVKIFSRLKKKKKVGEGSTWLIGFDCVLGPSGTVKLVKPEKKEKKTEEKKKAAPAKKAAAPAKKAAPTKKSTTSKANVKAPAKKAAPTTKRAAGKRGAAKA